MSANGPPTQRGSNSSETATAALPAAAIAALLRDQDRRRRLGLTMQERVKRYYDLNVVDDAYATIYRRHIEAPSQAVV